MRIALVYDLVYPFSKGGVERRLADIGKGLADRGHEVHLYGTKMWPGPEVITRDGLVIHGVPAPSRIHTRAGRRSGWHALVYALRLQTRLARERFDLVDIQSMAPLAAVASLLQCRLRGMRAVVTWHEVWGSGWTTYLKTPLGYLGIAAERLLARLASAQVAVSVRTAKRVRELLGVSDVTVVEGGVDLGLIDTVEPSSSAADVVYVGRLDRHKNVGRLVEAVGLLTEKGGGVGMQVIGEGPCSEELQAAAREIPQIRFSGAVEDTAEVVATMKGAKLFVSTSEREGFGLAVLEAMGCGLAVVVTSQAENAAQDLVVSGHNGMVVAPEASELATAIEKLFDNDPLRTEMGRNARATAEGYDLERAVGRTEDFYVALMSPFVPRSEESVS